MAFSYGFYNSLNGDRKYDSEDLSRMFDGIIYDGVIGAVGDTFAVKAGTGNTVNVSSGRAWFNHTWTYNDAPMPISCGSAAVLLDRYDAIVLEVNAASDVRKNSIKVVTGTEASNPVKPTMENTEFVHQYPLAYILRKAGSSSISQSNIENAVGTEACPICTGVLKSLNVEQMMAQWEAQFDEWFQSAKDTLSGDVAGNLLNKIEKAEDKIPYMYTATLSVNNWIRSSGTYYSNGYIYKQTATMVPDISSAPVVTASSTFTSGIQFIKTQVPSTDDTLAEVQDIINDGITVSGYNSVDVYVKEKPNASINARWQLTK
jgi:hypothetical protein